MAEAFTQTVKRDYVGVSALPDTETVLHQLPALLAHYNDLHPHRELGYRAPHEFIARSNQETPSNFFEGKNKREHAPLAILADSETVMRLLPTLFEHYKPSIHIPL